MAGRCHGERVVPALAVVSVSMVIDDSVLVEQDCVVCGVLEGQGFVKTHLMFLLGHKHTVRFKIKISVYVCNRPDRQDNIVLASINNR